MKKLVVTALTSALVVGTAMTFSGPAHAVRPGTTIITSKKRFTCNVGTTASAGYTRGSVSCFNPGVYAPIKGYWFMKVTCNNGSVSNGNWVEVGAHQWSSDVVGWCWTGVRDIQITDW